MSISEQTLNAMQLTTSFPCDSRDLYSLAQVRLSAHAAQAAHCAHRHLRSARARLFTLCRHDPGTCTGLGTCLRLCG